MSPVLAVAEALKKNCPAAEFMLIGGTKGPEEKMARDFGIDFASITSGKLRRYFSVSNIFLPYLLLKGYFEARRILKAFKPDAVFGAGSFVQVPVMWAAYFLRIPIIIHQQDLEPTLSNKLCEWCAAKITVSFEKSIKDFSSGFGLFYKKTKDKVRFTGNPFRRQLAYASKDAGIKHFGLKNNMPTLLVLGGGTGSEFLNKLVIDSLPELKKYVQILHGSGKQKSLGGPCENYIGMEFISDMGMAYAAADIVLSRCGLSVITELSALKKVAIFVPMPKSHQELNALFLAKSGAGIVAEQKYLEPEVLVRIVRGLLFNYEVQKKLSHALGGLMPKRADERIAKIILNEIGIQPE